MTPRFMVLFLVIIFNFIHCSSDAQDVINTTKAFPNLKFNRPVDLQDPGNNSNKLYVVEQAGKIFVFDNDASTKEKMLFLDIEERVNDRGNEEGLLGLAFHPQFKENGYFFVNYTASSPKRTIIARFKDQGSSDKTANTELKILEFEQPYSNHNGGQLLFGPDGYLYIAIGDGGSGGDPQGNGQNLKTLLGSIVRIDVNNSGNYKNYSIPSDNAFAGNDKGYREEIFAYGLRNPWRFCFHPETQEIWTGDVGQNKIEEIDIVTNGGNYGWNYMEGSECYDNSSNCNDPDLIKPIFEYDHSIGQSITGGYFYTKGDIEKIKDAYIYADFVSGKIWALFEDKGSLVENILLTKAIPTISSFGKDSADNLFVLSFNGSIYKFISQ